MSPTGADAVQQHLRPGTLRLASLPPLALYLHLPWCLKKCPYCDFNSHEWRGGGDAVGKHPGSNTEGAGTLPVFPTDTVTRPAPPAEAALGLGHDAHATAPMAYRGDHAARPVPPAGGAAAIQGVPITIARRPAGPPPTLARPGVADGSVPERRYIDALIADLEAALPLVWGRRVVSVFVGGGTPSLFSPDAIARLLSEVRARLPLSPGCEITLEANPGSFERERFRAYRTAGVTRLSVGVQSFDDAALQRLGRVHDAAQARAAVAEARSAFDTFNIDLMYALPGQTLPALHADLDAALAFAPPHLSVYHLTVEPNTLFANAPPPNLPDDDLASEMLDAIAARTAAAGLQRYEVSAFARAGHRCQHNLNYWQFGDYLGLGAGAHGKISFPQRVLRQVRWREPAAYMAQALAGNAVSNQHEVARADLAFEFMLGALRLPEGFELQRFAERTGLPLSAVMPTLEAARDRGLVDFDGLSGVRPTARGFDFLSDLQSMFLPAATRR